jgi:hypothetical protein
MGWPSTGSSSDHALFAVRADKRRVVFLETEKKAYAMRTAARRWLAGKAGN